MLHGIYAERGNSSMTRKIVIYLAFLVLSVGGGLVIGINNIPGEWYIALAKPPFTPPNWLFAPAWTLLYIMIGIAGAKSFLGAYAKQLVPLWALQMLLNFVWSPLFFTVHTIVGALVVIVALETVIVYLIVKARKIEPVVSLLFLPYAAWVLFATYLNASIFYLN